MITCLPPALNRTTVTKPKVSDQIWHSQIHEFYYQQQVPKKLDQNKIPQEIFDFVSDEDEFESDVDDDDEELEDDGDWIEEPESPNDLLHLASSASLDIQRYFQRNKGNDDFCDVFQDRFKSIKSGRELYYADLLAVAQFGSEGVTKRPISRKTNEINQFVNVHTITTPSGKICQCNLPHTGTINTTIGLGPFQELFDSVLRDSLIKETKGKCSSKNSTSFLCRKLPESFWEEPGTTLRNLNPTTQSKTLDFDDLLADWTADNSNYV